MQKHVNLVDLVKSFPTNIFLQNLASIQKRTSPIKFAHLAEKSEKGSVSNLSTKLRASRAAAACRSRRRRPPEQREGWKVDHASKLETCRDTSLPFRIGTMLAEDSCSHIPDCKTSPR